MFYEKIEQSYQKLYKEDSRRDQVLNEYLAKTKKIFSRFEQDMPLKKAIHSLNERDSFDEILQVLENEDEVQIFNRVSNLVIANSED